jgi:hypothetical protein
MKGKFFMLLPVVFILIAAGFQGTASGTCYLCHEDMGYQVGLHHNSFGMDYWYAARHGGLENISGYDYKGLPCYTCHAQNCARCHGEDSPTGPPYSGDKAQTQTMCLGCHSREGAAINSTPQDVHFAAGMKCTDCHDDPTPGVPSKDLHGDGTLYVSLREKDAIKTKCENCHIDGDAPKPPTDTGNKLYSHNTHTATLDCKACHQSRVISCYNCHLDTARVTTNRVAYKQIKDWVFLINYQGKVTSANMQNYVAGDLDNVIPAGNTGLMFAPVHSHSIMSQGRGCTDCHGTAIVRQIYNKKRLNLTWLEGGVLKNQTGVIPVAAGTVYKFISYDKDNTVGTGTGWVELSTKPQKPDLKMYSVGFGTPLTRKQMSKLK